MSRKDLNQDEFYIGWQEKAPRSYAQVVRRFIGTTLVIVLLVASLLVINQRGFVDSVFELGKLTTHQGILVKSPVPLLKIPAEKDGNGKQLFNSILLIGFGKHGAEATLAAIAEAQGQELEGRTVQLRGTLIYYQGKTALELTEGVDAFAGFLEDKVAYQKQKTSFGNVSLRGEILDPKCALGVMKPGYGKPHRSCAVRCISGGIPPILKIASKNGETNYCIVVGKDGERVNQELLSYVADQVQLCGRLEQQDDWLVLYTDPQSDIHRLMPYWMLGEVPMCNTK